MIEEWKIAKITPISKSHPVSKIYEVSNLGRVKLNGKLVNLYAGGDTTISGKRLYRWVAELFIPNPENKPCVDHIDRDHNNNTVENLRWSTYKENNNNPNTLAYRNDGHIKYEWMHVSRKCNNETRKKMSEARKKWYKSHEHHMKGKHRTDEEKINISIGTKKAMESIPKEKLATGLRGKHWKINSDTGKREYFIVE